MKRKTSQQYRFELQYENKKWDGLKEIGELARYSVITGYAFQYFPSPSVLDLGCGEGILQEKMAHTHYKSYLGIDFSSVAIDNAKKLEDNRTRFLVGDLNHLVVDGKFDVIIYNESLNYLSDPVKAVEALFPHLNPGGIFVISLVDKHGKEQTALWNKLAPVLQLKDRTKVINSVGHLWTIQVYCLRGAG
ncbi:MAG: class I SAM-dependent methyltransferase [Taibaiella sp.]|nr:class I SAM-dependent methyltransferase [Taibaiella sp.]